MALRSLPSDLSDWKGKSILVRIDWNIPLHGQIDGGSSLKIERSLGLIHRLQYAGAKIVLMTHLGRPQSAKDTEYSAKQLLPFLKKSRLNVLWLGGDIMNDNERGRMLETVTKAPSGSVFLLENVRFYPGEEKNDSAFAKDLAIFGEVFINDAFAVSHRAHASVVGVAKVLPSYAGPGLEEEVSRIGGMMKSAKKPFIAFIGGGKISTKIKIIEALRKKTQALYLGGAMSLACEAARGKSVGASRIETGQKVTALHLMKQKNIHLPVDYIVTDSLKEGAKMRVSDLSDIKKGEYAVDVGPRTLVMWAEAIRGAASALWNGPVGITEVPAFGAGSRGLARFLGYMPHNADTLVGGGDTLPVLVEAGVIDRIGFVSTGGGAMLEFLGEGEKLPGLKALQETTASRRRGMKKIATTNR